MIRGIGMFSLGEAKPTPAHDFFYQNDSRLKI